MQILITIIGSGAIFAFIQFLIKRHDEKKGVLATILQDIKQLKKDREEDKATDARRRILAASDEIRNTKIHHSKEWFDQLSRDIDGYETYCNSHENYKNNEATMAIDFLRNTYRKCMADNDFL